MSGDDGTAFGELPRPDQLQVVIAVAAFGAWLIGVVSFELAVMVSVLSISLYLVAVRQTR